jgi:hypothetical protein
MSRNDPETIDETRQPTGLFRGSCMKYVLVLYIVGTIYAIIRYVAFSPENISNLPIFIINKGVSMSAALCFAMGFLQQLRSKQGLAISVDPGLWFRAGVFGAIVHIPISLAILRPAYFPEFFADGDRLKFAGEVVFLFGGLTAAGIFLLLRPSWNAHTRWLLSIGAMLTLITHVLAMGYCRGLNINRSHAYLPPMWLLSAIGIALALWWLLRSRPTQAEQ